jgi:hypothetical protein
MVQEFTAEYKYLCPARPELGRVAVLPWDARIFGFPVGEYRCGDARHMVAASGDLRTGLAGWAADSGVELCAGSVPATDGTLVALLPELGFRFVDFNIRVTLRSLQAARLPQARIELRRPQPGEAAAVAGIAERAFQFGRYFADSRFPKDLAAHRYRAWMENAMATTDPGSRVYVFGAGDRLDGFYHVQVQDGVADLRLAAVDVHLQRTLLGFDLYAATLAELKASGVRQAISKISACNTAVLNIYAMLGFQFSTPEAVFHWYPGTVPKS